MRTAASARKYPAPDVVDEVAVGPGLAASLPRIRTVVALLIGRAVRRLARMRSGGTATPGYVVERLDPGFAKRTLARLPRGVVVISGTNGKTTTTKIVAELLRACGLAVFTNPSGSNSSRGVVSALLASVDLVGRLDADIAVLELDEAHGARFVRSVRPRHALLLNVYRDQLDRFGEIDHTARLLGEIAGRTTGKVVLNRDDPRIAALASLMSPERISYFGAGPDLASSFPNDDVFHGAAESEAASPNPTDVLLTGIARDRVSLRFDGREHTTKMRLLGSYDKLNAAAAVALVRAVLDDAPSTTAACDAPRRTATLLGALARVTPAFGRGEVVDVGGTAVELILVKNPVGFRLSLQSFDPAGRITVIAINDNDNDSRDVSWLWDVDFGALRFAHEVILTGTRAHDMALRLRYDEVPDPLVFADFRRAIAHGIDLSGERSLRVFCSYTAMLQLRRHLMTLTRLRRIDE